jgi:hypothetical protein
MFQKELSSPNLAVLAKIPSTLGDGRLKEGGGKWPRQAVCTQYPGLR